ncbi:MAG: hypothetical protein K8I29_10340 [Alphaproteobacteria bacterium]|uniref:Stringent starvation protein B n=1 Tax=Candidatus Nitrobium versatile TaxID=2884831 RepID=A0A953M217_9BACT|nr:hypothetical protein [Candidatus Nitrobium versatile]
MEAPDETLNKLKKHIFYEFLQSAGRVFILVRYSDKVTLGTRGFTAEERDNGIILVFNNRMNFSWDEYGISVTLVFGTSPHRCSIPADDITAVYSPEMGAQFVVTLQNRKPLEVRTEEKTKTETEEEGIIAEKIQEPSKNVIQVDFTKKKK